MGSVDIRSLPGRGRFAGRHVGIYCSAGCGHGRFASALFVAAVLAGTSFSALLLAVAALLATAAPLVVAVLLVDTLFSTLLLVVAALLTVRCAYFGCQ